MDKTTKNRLIDAASDLLDGGGQSAVTIRAVAEVVGFSHNTPYRHFRDRDALMAAIAERDFAALSRTFRTGDPSGHARDALRAALVAVIAYAREHPARYRLLFSEPDIATEGGSMEVAALDAFQAFGALVARCQETDKTLTIETAKLAGLIYATLHGSIDLELGGRARKRKGLGDIEATVNLLLNFIWTT